MRKSTFLYLLVVACSACNPQPDSRATETLRSAAPAAATPTADTTSGGVVYFSTDLGNTWVNQSTGLPTSVEPTDLALSASQQLALASKQQGIFLFDATAAKWVKVPGRPASDHNVDAVCFYNNRLFVGTHNGGVCVSGDLGATWAVFSKGLGNLIIRRLVVVDQTLLAGTNGGLYALDNKTQQWVLEYNNNTLQVNGITELDGEVFIGTNHGAYQGAIGQKNWQLVLPNRSLHNISTDGQRVYAMTYGELFVSDDHGATWTSDQQGMPQDLYSFQVVTQNGVQLVGQWHGVYKKDQSNQWALTEGALKGVPITEMKVFGKVVVAASSGWARN